MLLTLEASYIKSVCILILVSALVDTDLIRNLDEAPPEYESQPLILRSIQGTLCSMAQIIHLRAVHFRWDER